MTAVIQLAISRDNLLTSNQRLHHMAKARKTRAIREMARVMAYHERPAKMQAATCVVEVKWSKLKRARDAHNVQPTAKAAIDGIVGDYGLLPSDSDEHLRKVSFSASAETHDHEGIACFLTLTFTEVQP
jgi:ferritin-like metal-binding protein YciE